MNERASRRALRLATVATAMVALLASSALAERTKVTTVEGITEYDYDNGLRVLLFPDNSKPTVTVNITYLVGSRHEGRGEKGMAHLLEHMVFKGTPDHPNIWKALEDHGARFNGSTWVDRTNYFETLPSSDPSNFEWALKMEADRMINSNILREDLDKEMTVVRNEFEMGENNPVGVLWERMMSAAFLWHNYGDSTIGNRSDIERVPIPNLRVFYKRYYQPDNAMLVVAGDFKEEKALAMIDQYFGSIPRPERTLDATYTLEPIQDGARHVELRRAGDVGAVGTAYHICAGSHADFPALDAIETILTDEPSGRLYKALVASGMASSTSGVAFGWREPGILLNFAQIRMEDPIDPVLAKMTEVIEGLGANPITQEELDRAKRKMLKNIDLALKDSGRIGVQMSEWAAAGDWRLLFIHRDRIENLTLDQVRRVATQYFKASNRTSGVFYPTKDPDRTEVPETPNILALVRDYKGKAALAEGEEWDATPENVEKRVTRTKVGDIELALLPKETRGDVVRANITLRFGTEGDLKGHTTATGMIGDMLMRGTKNHTYQQINDAFDELKANVRIGGGGGFGTVANSIGVSIKTERQNLGKVIELVGEILEEPTFPTDEFEVVKKDSLARLEEQLSDPQALAFAHMFRELNPYPSDDVRYIPTLPEQVERLKAVNADELKQLHKNLFGATHMQVSVVGDFDPNEIKQTVQKTFGAWKSPKPFARIASKFRGDVKGSESVIQTPDKEMAIVGCATNMELRDDDPDYAALHLANYILGASAKSRLLDRLRQKEGLSYGAFSFCRADSQDRDALWAGGAICAPQNANKAAESLLDEFDKLVKEGIPADELADAKKSFALRVESEWANDAQISGRLNEGLYLDRKMNYYRNLYDSIEKLTPGQIHAAIKKHLSMGRMVKVKAGDLKETNSVD